jgi:hypothetical protein
LSITKVTEILYLLVKMSHISKFVDNNELFKSTILFSIYLYCT